MLGATQESLERKRDENLLTERHTEDLVIRFVEMSDSCGKQDEEMLDMRKAFETNRSETISFRSGRFKRELEAHQAEHKQIMTIEEIEFGSLIQDLSEQNAGLQRQLGDAARFSGTGEHVPTPGGFSFRKEQSTPKLRTEVDEKTRDPYPIPEELFAR